MLYPAHPIYSRSSYFKQRSPHQVTKFNIIQIAMKSILMVHFDKYCLIIIFQASNYNPFFRSPYFVLKVFFFQYQNEIHSIVFSINGKSLFLYLYILLSIQLNIFLSKLEIVIATDIFISITDSTFFIIQ